MHTHTLTIHSHSHAHREPFLQTSLERQIRRPLAHHEALANIVLCAAVEFKRNFLPATHNGIRCACSTRWTQIAYVKWSQTKLKLFNFWTENFWLLFSADESHSATCGMSHVCLCVLSVCVWRRELTQDSSHFIFPKSSHGRASSFGKLVEWRECVCAVTAFVIKFQIVSQTTICPPFSDACSLLGV